MTLAGLVLFGARLAVVTENGVREATLLGTRRFLQWPELGRSKAARARLTSDS
jgi:hypothetical protein